jgi:hypothetical protein
MSAAISCWVRLRSLHGASVSTMKPLLLLTRPAGADEDIADLAGSRSGSDHSSTGCIWSRV